MTNSTATRAGFDPAKVATLRAAVDKVIEIGASSVQFRVADGDAVLTVTSGSAELGKNAPVPEDGRFRIACVTKMFVSIVLLQLGSEGKIDLDASVERYLPGLLPCGSRIAVRNLMNHTSGLYNHADSFQRPGDRFLRDRYRHFEAEELVGVAAKRPLNFEPSTTFEYSNTNYIVLGLLIGRVTGSTYTEQIRQRILEPLGLRNTFLPGDDPEIPGPHARGYMKIKGRSEDVTALNPSEACSAGEMISTTADLDRFLVALMKGELLDEAAFTEMKTTIPAEWVTLPMSNGYGLGFMPFQTRRGMSLWGHGGGIPGYATFAGSTLDGRKRLVTSIGLDIDPDDFSGVFENSVVDAINAGADCL
jgi:D-alanyl-D-alanine carboxypeptidase